MENTTSVKVPWSGRGLAYSDEEIAVAVDAMRHADPQTQGGYQAEFESRFATFSASSHAFAVSSCTAALELTALLCRLGPDDEVILPAHTFAATAIPFARTGARLVWADIDPDTWVATADTIQPLLSPRTRVIVVVHLYGLVCEMDPILALARENGLLVIEDAAQAVGATFRERPAGSMGDFGCFSFHTHKNISTLGEGGVLTVRDPRHARLVPGLRHNGMHPYEGDRPHYWIPAMTDVDFDLDGVWPYNFCIGEVQCALASKLLDRLPAINADRQARAHRFMTALADFPELVFQRQPADCGHTHHLLAARYDGRSRDDLMDSLFNTYGVKTVVQYCPLYRYPMFRKAGFGDAECPETDRFFDHMVSFPFHHWMPEEQFAYMIEATRAALGEQRTGG